MVRPIFTDMDAVELKYYPLMIILSKCTGKCNVLSPKICVPKKTKDINVKGFNMITNKIEAKLKTKRISCACKCKSNSSICNSNQKWNNKTYHCECKTYPNTKKVITGIQAHVFVRILSI